MVLSKVRRLLYRPKKGMVKSPPKMKLVDIKGESNRYIVKPKHYNKANPLDVTPEALSLKLYENPRNPIAQREHQKKLDAAKKFLLKPHEPVGYRIANKKKLFSSSSTAKIGRSKNRSLDWDLDPKIQMLGPGPKFKDAREPGIQMLGPGPGFKGIKHRTRKRSKSPQPMAHYKRLGYKTVKKSPSYHREKSSTDYYAKWGEFGRKNKSPRMSPKVWSRKSKSPKRYNSIARAKTQKKVNAKRIENAERMANRVLSERQWQKMHQVAESMNKTAKNPLKKYVTPPAKYGPRGLFDTPPSTVSLKRPSPKHKIPLNAPLFPST